MEADRKEFFSIWSVADNNKRFPNKIPVFLLNVKRHAVSVVFWRKIQHGKNYYYMYMYILRRSLARCTVPQSAQSHAVGDIPNE